MGYKEKLNVYGKPSQNTTTYRSGTSSDEYWDKVREDQKEWTRQMTERDKAFWNSMSNMFQFRATVNATNNRNPYPNDG